MAAFDALKEFFKSVTGPVAAGQTLRLRVSLPRAFKTSYCTLVLHKDGQPLCYENMLWDGTDETDEWWTIELAIPSPGLYFYHFQYETPWGVSPLKRHENAFTGDIYGTQDWELTVYDPAMKTPESFLGGTFYQIFPDRFAFSGQKKKNVPKDRVMHRDTSETPVYLPDEKGEYLNNDYFGGDLAGIREKLPYIASLGVTAIYLNPVCEAHSNHRYNTADYRKVDPLLGTNEDLRDLCDEAHKLGLKIVLDGVFSHTGDDSIYFNKYGRYPELGAYQSRDSRYYPWYSFGKTRDDYTSWWGVKTLPEVNEENPDYLDFITGEGGVLDLWFSLGIDGVRLDVADELPDVFLDALRRAVKRHGEDKLILGEVWENAVTKISHGGRRRYFDGRQLDCVMNYPFRTALLEFALDADAEKCAYRLSEIADAYPPAALHLGMNLLGTHDTSRLLTALTGAPLSTMSRVTQAELTYDEETLARAKKRLKLICTMNHFLPGLPSIYYGDEAGMLGGKDPLNRAFFPWGKEDGDLVSFFRRLGALRKELPVLRDGGFYLLSAGMGCLAFLRYKEGERRVAVIANNNDHEIWYTLNPDMRGMLERGRNYRTGDAVLVEANSAVVLTD